MSSGPQFDLSLSRRTLLTGGSVAALAGLVGCSSEAQVTPSTTPSWASPSPNRTPRSGGQLRIGLDRPITSLDPVGELIGQQPMLILANAIYEPLLAPTPGGWRGIQAQSMRPGSDAADWTLRLRSGLVFSNGDPLDADAVIAHLRRLADPATGAASLRSAQQIASMTARDSYTVEFRLAAPNIAFDGEFARQLGMIGHPSAVDELGFPIGAGAYVVADFGADQITLARAPHYWRTPGLAETIEYHVVPDADQRFRMLLDGELDAVWSEVSAQISDARSSHRYVVSSAPSAASCLLMNQANPRLQDFEVRRAIIRAIDRDGLRRVLDRGEGVALDGPYALLGLTPRPAPEYPEYNEDAARAVLGDLGLELRMLVEERSDTLARAEAVAEMLGLVGLRVTIEPVASAGYRDRLASGDFDLADFVTSVFSDARGAARVFGTDGDFNYTGFSDAQLDTAAAAALGTLNSTDRAWQYGVVTNRLIEQAVVAWYTAADAGLICAGDMQGVPSSAGHPLVSLNPRSFWR